jgi:hypothetical protein
MLHVILDRNKLITIIPGYKLHWTGLNKVKFDEQLLVWTQHINTYINLASGRAAVARTKTRLRTNVLISPTLQNTVSDVWLSHAPNT